MEGWKKRGVENLTNDTPPKKGLWTPARTVRFPPPSGVSALFFLYKNPRQSRPEALFKFWRGPEIFGRARSLVSGHVRPRQGPEICNFGAPSPLEALHWIFLLFFSSIYVQFSKMSPLESGEKVAKNPVEKIASNPVTSVAVMVFSAPMVRFPPPIRFAPPISRPKFEPQKLQRARGLFTLGEGCWLLMPTSVERRNGSHF